MRIFIFALSLCLPAVLHGETLLERNREMIEYTPQKKERFDKLKELYAHEFQVGFVKTKATKTTSARQYFAPGDAIVDPNFDDDENWANNPDSLKNGVLDLRARIPSRVYETGYGPEDGELYIVWTKYQVGGNNHFQQAEAILTVAQKEKGKPNGSLRAVIFNDHGFAFIVAKDPAFQKTLRENYYSLVQKEKGFIAAQKARSVFVIDPGSTAHAKAAPTFLKSQDGEERGMKIYVCAGTNGLYPCDEEALKREDQKVMTYRCVKDGAEGKTICSRERQAGEDVVGYANLDQDQMWADLFPWNAAANEEAAAKRSQLAAQKFEGSQDPQIRVPVSDGILALRKGLPQYIVHYGQEAVGEANMFNDWSAKLGTPNAFPHVFWSKITQGTGLSVSDHYLHNPDVEYIEYKPAATQPSAMSGSCERSRTALLKSVEDVVLAAGK